MKYLILFLLTTFNFFAKAQNQIQKPDYKKIEKNCRDVKSPFLHKPLFERYLKGDTSFTLEEKRHLYYGYQFTNDYSPFSGVLFRDSLNAVLEKQNKTLGDYQSAIRFCDSIISSDPFNLRTLNTQTNLYKITAEDAAKQRNLNKMNQVIDAILSSGDGISTSTAYYVIAVSHEYSIISILGLESTGSQSLIGQTDKLELKENELGLTHLYFDVSASFSAMNKMFNK